MLSIIGELKLGAPTIRVMQLERTVRLSQPLYSTHQYHDYGYTYHGSS